MKIRLHYDHQYLAIAILALASFSSFSFATLGAYSRCSSHVAHHRPAENDGFRFVQSDQKTDGTKPKLVQEGSVYFVPNKGQDEPWIKYSVFGVPFPATLTGDGIQFIMTKVAPDPQPSNDPRTGTQQAGRKHPRSNRQTTEVFMQLAGSSHNATIEALDEMDTKISFFVGDDPSKFRPGLPTYQKVRYTNIYPGINLLFYGKEGQLEYDFIVAPETKVEQIDIRFTPPAEVSVDNSGDLLVHWNDVEVRHHKPLAYQIINGVKQYIEAKYIMLGPNKVAIRVPEYDHNKGLTIDPTLSMTESNH